MTKTQLCNEAKISTNAMAKLGKGEDVRVEVLIRICSILGCAMDDIMEIIPDASDNKVQNLFTISHACQNVTKIEVKFSCGIQENR